MTKRQNYNRSKKPKRRDHQYEPQNKNYLLQKAKGNYRPDNNDPTHEEVPLFMDSVDLNYDLPEDINDKPRPSEKGFSFEGFVKPLIITIIAAIILGIGGWVFSHEKKIALIEQTDRNQDESLSSTNKDLNDLEKDVEVLKSDQN